MTAPPTLQLAHIMKYPQFGASTYAYDGQVMWLPKFNQKGKK